MFFKTLGTWSVSNFLLAHTFPFSTTTTTTAATTAFGFHSAVPVYIFCNCCGCVRQKWISGFCWNETKTKTDKKRSRAVLRPRTQSRGLHHWARLGKVHFWILLEQEFCSLDILCINISGPGSEYCVMAWSWLCYSNVSQSAVFIIIVIIIISIIIIIAVIQFIVHQGVLGCRDAAETKSASVGSAGWALLPAAE